MIHKAKLSQIDSLLTITRACAVTMKQQGIFQWNEYYPTKGAFEIDCKRGELYSYLSNKIIIGCITVSTHKDEEYKKVDWLTRDTHPYYIHRLAVHPLHQKKGIAQQLMTFAENLARNQNCNSIRLDTFSKNERNQRFYEQRGYKKVGKVYFPKQSDAPFYCFELVL